MDFLSSSGDRDADRDTVTDDDGAAALVTRLGLDIMLEADGLDGEFRLGGWRERRERVAIAVLQGK
jgi:hypothetical protein